MNTKLITYLLGALLAATAFAQTPAPVPVDTFINGELFIEYNTRTQRDGDKPKATVTDKYRLKVNVSNSILFDGTIESLPFIKGTISDQQGSLTHSIDCFVVNPKNPAQTRNIGRLFGAVPVDSKNVYRFEDGNLKIGIFGAGNAGGFESKVKGLALGKAPADTSLWSKVRDRAKLSISKNVNGKTVALTVTKYDQMEFQGHVLAAGPVQLYPETTVSGPMVYDYDREAWYFNGVTVTYATEENGRRIMVSDKLSGNIRWVPAANRSTSGEGEYQFDIRVNEEAASEGSMFAGPAKEEDFFATDVKVRGLTGTMKYKDTIVNDVTTRSLVKIDLKGNQLTKPQAGYLAKLLLMSTIVPLNSD